MPTSAIVASNNAILALQQAQIHANRVAACTLSVRDYQHNGASVVEMHSYAGCVGTLYPQPATGSEVIFVKAMIVLALIGAAIGIFRDRDSDIGMRIAGSLIGAMGLPIFGLALICAYFGIVYLFS